MTRTAVGLTRATMIGLFLLVGVGRSEAGVLTFTDRAAFLAALGATTTDDFESYALGTVADGTTLGDFVYSYDDTVLQPGVVAGGFGGQALGGPFDVFVGGDALTLTFAGGGALRAFGADFPYAPSFDVVPAGVYRVRVDDGAGAGAFAASPVLDATGGIFFLGVIADPGSEFHSVSLMSVVPLDQNDDPMLVPAYQVDNLVYAAAEKTPVVPEPATLTLVTLGGLAAAAARRRR